MSKVSNPSRKELAILSTGRGTTVRVVREWSRDKFVSRVLWYSNNRRRTKDFPDTPKGLDDAKAYANRVYDAKIKGISTNKLTIHEVWMKFKVAEFRPLKEKTKKNYEDSWGYFELFASQSFLADDLTHEKLDELRDALLTERKPPLSVETVSDVFTMIRRVYRWAEGRDLIARNRAESYRFKVAKSEKPVDRAEFTPDERELLIGSLDPESSREWRAWVGLVLCGTQGVRQVAALGLQWPDISEDGRLVTWRAETDKNGKPWVQPIRERTRQALRVAMKWREKKKYDGPYVLFPGRGGKGKNTHYTIQSLYSSLLKAQRRAGIKHIKGRGGHGLRKTVAGDLADITGDPTLAMHGIGNKDPRMGMKYIKPRLENIQAAFDMLDGLSGEFQAENQEGVNKPSTGRAVKRSGAARKTNVTPMGATTYATE